MVQWVHLRHGEVRDLYQIKAETLGEGGFGHVHLGTNKANGKKTWEDKGKHGKGEGNFYGKKDWNGKGKGSKDGKGGKGKGGKDGKGGKGKGGKDGGKNGKGGKNNDGGKSNGKNSNNGNNNRRGNTYCWNFHYGSGCQGRCGYSHQCPVCGQTHRQLDFH